jgi:RNA polymerase sigma-70 factor (ECF subfamily)
LDLLRLSDLEAALNGDGRTLRRLVDELGPTVEQNVIRGLFRQRTRARGRDVRQEIDDMMQEVFASLFEDHGRALRAWCPERGLPLKRFVGLLAERQVAAILRSGRRTPWRHDSLETELIEARPSREPSPAARAEARDFGEAVVERVLEELSPRGIQLFELLFVEERSVEDIVQIVGVSPDVVYAWRSRLLKRSREVVADLEAESTSSVRNGEPANKEARA